MRFWCDKKFAVQARSVIAQFDSSLPVQTIFSGKFRRYHNLSVLRQLLRPVSIVLPNVRDACLVVIGFVESVVRLVVWRPDVVFTKGGYVCLPVGIAARVLRIPLVIHDSDAHPGLTNRVLARWATVIATGAPLEHYSYPADRSVYVGIPISADFAPLTADEKKRARNELGLDQTRPLVVITGGGLGATRLNNAVMRELDRLQKVSTIVLLSGTAQYDELRRLVPENSDQFQLHAFISHGMARLLSAADIVVARAGATTILELAALHMPTILVPNGFLTGGHQLKNAAVYEKRRAVVVLDEHKLDVDSSLLTSTVTHLLADPDERQRMGEVFSTFARPNAAKEMADLILKSRKT